VSEDVPALVDHLFRHRYGALVAGLTRALGPARLDLAEDLAQEALLRALKAWPFRGVPDNPAAWLHRVARNLAVDAARRARLEPVVLEDLAAWREEGAAASAPDEIADDTLRMVFTCCHPALSETSQVALTLKTVCGLGVSEISRALLSQDATVAQRLSRAKARLQEHDIRCEAPAEGERGERLAAVHRVLYLLFNEGYSARRGDDLVRHDLVQESVRLGGVLVRQAAGDTPASHALLALFLLQGARLPGRIGDASELLLLREQDRQRWNRSWIAAGFAHLERAGSGSEVGRYHLEAAIAAVHASASDYESTDWARMLGLYDRLVQLVDSPVVRVNRAVVVAKVDGAAAGLDALADGGADQRLREYPPYAVTEGMLSWAAGDVARATAALTRALALDLPEPQRRFLEERLERCRAGQPSTGF